MKTFIKITIYTIGAIALSVASSKLTGKLTEEVMKLLEDEKAMS